MPEVADVFRRFGGSYLEAHGAAMLPSHRRAIADIIARRTEVLGGQQWGCNECGTMLHVFHSCRNRACPKCHGKQTQAWLEQRRAEMLPVPYFHVTVTVPEELRAALRRHQIDGYGALMKTTTGAIIDLARDPRWVGGTVGVLAVLHTWTQRLIFHPHVHCLVTCGGLSSDGATWHPAGNTFLFPKSTLATLVRARFRDAFAKLCLDVDLPRHVWRTPWVVHITPWGEGQYPSAEGRLFLVGLICDLDVGGGQWCPLNIGGHLLMSGEPQRSRRRWGEAFKRRVVAEAAEPGVSVASVARRHDLNANLLFNWRRRYGAEGSFLPVALVPCGPSPAEIAKEAAGPYRAGRIEIALAAGHRVTLEGGFDPDAVARLVRELVS